jgi:UDP-glucose 4-epimerase
MVRREDRHWTILWAAGAGVIGTDAHQLQGEIATWQWFLELLSDELLPAAHSATGTIFLASSAGGIYGRGLAETLTEASAPCPISDYGRCKLLQEELLQAWAAREPGIRYLIGRISNLYGPGQKLNKRQGLISHLSRQLIHRQPAHIYVPLDTIRDYIFAEDCADQIVLSLRHLGAGNAQGKTKLFVSEESTSVAQIVRILTRICHSRPRIICSPSPLRRQHPRQMKFRSLVWPDARPARRTSLVTGISRVHLDNLALYRQGRLPGPSSETLRVNGR